MRCLLWILLSLSLASPAVADVTVKNKSRTTIEVAVDNSKKTKIENSDRVVFACKKSEVVVKAYYHGSEKASSTVKNGRTVKVTHDKDVWSISED